MKRKSVYSRENFSYCLIILLIGMIVSSCEKRDISQGEKSIEGTWSVTEMHLAHGRADNQSTSIDSVEMFTDELGSFDFTEDRVTWTFEPGDSISIDNENWALSSQKENSGFVRVRKFTLSTDSFEFDCVFDDETKNSEKNAERIHLTYQSNSLGHFYRLLILMDKE